jgi:hypothetical protein
MCRTLSKHRRHTVSSNHYNLLSQGGNQIKAMGANCLAECPAHRKNLLVVLGMNERARQEAWRWAECGERKHVMRVIGNQK